MSWRYTGADGEAVGAVVMTFIALAYFISLCPIESEVHVSILDRAYVLT